MHMRYCRGLGIALKLFGKFNLEIQTELFCKPFIGDEAAIYANQLACLTSTQLHFKA